MVAIHAHLTGIFSDHASSMRGNGTRRHAAKKGDDAAPTAAPRRRQIALFLTAMLLGATGQQPPTFAGSDDY
ncbi:hypothetical protein [Xanthomonas arboricola]|uniref:hypothetical protein n=1 Tax=Xanthomonas arboricola TaxID=56448 RepID=UPI0011B01B63|nr:hypothetical protein [Xanthomonas arboricola]